MEELSGNEWPIILFTNNYTKQNTELLRLYWWTNLYCKESIYNYSCTIVELLMAVNSIMLQGTWNL